MDPDGDATTPWKAALVFLSEDESDSDASSIDAYDLRAKALTEQLAKHEADKLDNSQQLASLDAMWQRRRKPLLKTAAEVDAEIAKVKAALHHLARSQEAARTVPAPGPSSLSWVEDARFSSACNAVIVINIACMALSSHFYEMHLSLLLAVLGSLFLLWYIFELSVKFAYRRQTLFIGKLSVVWWNWLDLIIVVSGVLDEWLLPLFLPAGLSSSVGTFLKFLRFFRLLRILRLLRYWLHGDFSWTESPPFELFMTGVITVNALTMALELDYSSPVWPFVENIFLAIYTFELSCRIKYAGCGFFTTRGALVWNFLDLIMVVGGAVDLWLLPGVRLVQSVISDEPQVPETNLSGVLSLLKLMRILRVLRLVRLLKTIKPLYGLLMGVGEALKAMQWVLLLTLLILYAGAIIFTTLIKQDFLTPATEAGQRSFGSVPGSLLSLFELMNGNISIVDPITQTIPGQLSFAVFMVLSNWAVLATLTSVVSESMMSHTARDAEEDAAKLKAAEHRVRGERLRDLFQSIASDSDGNVSEQEWCALWRDPVLSEEIVDASTLSPHLLQDMFRCMAHMDSEGKRLVRFDSLIEYLDDVPAPADNRSVMHMASRLQDVQDQLQRLSAEMDRRHPK